MTASLNATKLFSMQKTKHYLLNLKVLVTVASLLVLFLQFSFSDTSPLWLTFLSALFLALSISDSVHSAEKIALRVGPGLGALILAVAVTIIEVGLILSLMANEVTDVSFIARDTVFAAIMIVTNGIIGISLLVGGIKHKELGFQPQGTSSLLAVLMTLAGLTLILPNYTQSTMGPTFSESQLIFASIASLILYIALVWAQTKTQKSYFEAPALQEAKVISQSIPSKQETIVNFVSLVVSLCVVIGLAKALSPAIEAGVKYIGAPPSFVGIVIALLVLAPEALAAISAAGQNQLQTSLNLALGSGAASIALTIPAVSLYSIMSGKTLGLGVDGKSTVFLLLTFILGGTTLATGRTTALQGLVHLVVMGAYLVMALVP